MTNILRIAAPFTLWIAAFSLIYGIEGLLCSRHAAGMDPSRARLVLIAAWAAAIGLQVGLLILLRAPRCPAPRFVRLTSVTLGVAALVATAWTLAPVAAMSFCR